jgi:hypothetical protein
VRIARLVIQIRFFWFNSASPTVPVKGAQPLCSARRP